MDIDQEFAQGEKRPGELTSPDTASPRPSEDLMKWPTITDEMIMENKTVTRPYTMVILKAGPHIATPGVEKIIWEHGRRNLSMRATGLLIEECTKGRPFTIWAPPGTRCPVLYFKDAARAIDECPKHT